MYCRKLKLRRTILQTKLKGKNYHELIRFICKKFFYDKIFVLYRGNFQYYNDVSFFNF